MGILDTLGDIGSDAEGMLPGFLNPNRQGPGGGGLGMDTLFDALRNTGSALANVSPAGIARGVVEGLNPGSDMDPFQRAMSIAPLALPLLGAGALRMGQLSGEAGGLGPMLSDQTGAVSINPDQARPFQQALNLTPGEDYPPVPTLSPDRTAGLNARSHMILGSPDNLSTVRAIGRWADDEMAPRREAAAGAVLGTLTAQGLQPDELRTMLTQVDFAYQRSLIKGTPQSDEFNKLYGQFLKTPEQLTPERIQQLTASLSGIYQTTRALDPELVIDPLLKVTNLQVLDAGQPAVVSTDLPLWNADAIHGASDVFQRERVRRLNQLNYRALYQPGVANLRYLLHRGMTDLADKLDRGPTWYQDQHDAINARADAAGIDPEKATAVVSLTSAQQDWRRNIPLAFNTMGYWDDPRAYNTDGTVNPDGAQAIASEMHARHMMVTTADVTKLLRAKNEDPSALFGGSKGGIQKQRNFFLNLAHPELADPVTVDRHAFDAFLGLDTGVEDRPLDARPEGQTTRMRSATKGPLDDQFNYNVIESAYRQVAQEVGMNASQAQAVVWETWKHLKDEHYQAHDLISSTGERQPGSSTWSPGINDPYRLNDYALSILEGSNPMGWRQVLTTAGTDMPPASPAAGQPTGVGVEASRGSFAVHAIRGNADATDRAVRIMYQAIPENQSGEVWRLAPGFPLRVAHYDEAINGLVHGALEPDGLPTPAGVEVYHPVIGADGTVFQHPATIPGRHGTWVVDTPRAMDAFRSEMQAIGIGGDAVREIRGVGSFEPGLTRNRLGLDDLAPGDFTSEDGPLQHNQWVGISAALSPERRALLKERGIDVGNWNDEAKHAELGRQLTQMGYKPINQTGEYEGSEPSWLVYGMKPSDASRLGDAYHQDSIVAPFGLLYGKESENAGSYTPALSEVKYVPDQHRYVAVGGKTPTSQRDTVSSNIEFNQKATDYYSVAHLNEGDVKYQVQLNPNFKSEPVNFDPDNYLSQPIERTHDLMWVQIPDDATQQRTQEIIDAAGRAGATRPTLYTHAPMGEGWTPIVEHHYQTTAPQPGNYSAAAGTTLPTTPAGITLVHRSRANGDLTAPNRFVAWMPDKDAGWLGEQQNDMNSASPVGRTTSKPVTQDDGSFIVNNDTRVVMNGTGGEVHPDLFTSMVDGRATNHFAIQNTPGQLPTVMLSPDPVAHPDLVTGQVMKRGVSLVVPMKGNDPDMSALSFALSVLRRNGVATKNIALVGANGVKYTTSGEAVA